jgi:hypothetical protein
MMYGMEHSIPASTPSWGGVDIASRSETTILELFWLGKSVLSANQCKAALAWLVAEGWFAYADDAIGDADQKVLKLIAKVLRTIRKLYYRTILRC